MEDEETAFLRQVTDKAALKLRAQRAGPPSVWFGLGMVGLVGWSVAAPTLLGVMLGAWLDRRRPGTHSWMLWLLVAGLVIGCANAWHWVTREHQAMHETPDTEDE
jgi:ATP synthase protein I